MQFTWAALIDRARTYVDDDSTGDAPGFLTPERWLELANVEYAQLRRRWIRIGLVSPAPTDTSFTGPTTTITSTLAVIGVAEDLGGGNKRVLSGSQSSFGRAPFWDTSSSGRASYYEVAGDGDSAVITLPGDDGGSYIARTIPTVAYATDDTTTIDLPYGCDERLVLGLARRSKLKESGASGLLNGLISEADAELNFTAFGRLSGDSPRVRVNPRRGSRGYSAMEYPTDPSLWRYV